jgi:hypothetical protein
LQHRRGAVGIQPLPQPAMFQLLDEMMIDDRLPPADEFERAKFGE